MAGDTKTFGPLSAEAVTSLLEHAKQLGMNITGQGQGPWTIATNQHNVVLSANYDANAKTATLQITSKDWFVPWSKVWEKISPLIPAPAVGGEANALDVAMLSLEDAMNAFDAALASKTDGVLGEDWKVPTAQEGAESASEADLSYLERAEQAVKDGIEKAKDLPRAAAKEVTDKARAAAKAIEKAADYMLDRGVPGTAYWLLKPRVEKLVADNKGLLVGLGVGYTATTIALAAVALWLLFKH